MSFFRKGFRTILSIYFNVNKMMYAGAMMTRSQNKQQQLEQAKDIVINSIGQTMDLYCR